MRVAALSIVVLACLAAPSPAAAHSRAPTVALDYRLELSTAPPGVHATVVDGDRALSLTVDVPHRLVVRGLLGEPVLRFGPDGVWVNRASPSTIGAAGAQLERKRNIAGSRASRTTSGSISKNVQLSPS